MENKSAAQCPNNDCTPRWLYNPDIRRDELVPVSFGNTGPNGDIGYFRWRLSNVTVTYEGAETDTEAPEKYREFISRQTVPEVPLSQYIFNMN